jgi:serine/threonine protein kinase
VVSVVNVEGSIDLTGIVNRNYLGFVVRTAPKSRISGIPQAADHLTKPLFKGFKLMIMTIHRSDTCEAHEELKVLKLSSKFHIHQVLGKGAFATVFLAQHRRKNLLHTEKSNKREIALKIINLHKIAARRRPRQLGDDDRNGITMSEMEEDDTEELFFPSRLEKRALDKNVCDDLEMTTVKNMIQMEINVHSYASKLRHPNIVSLLESFHYSLPGKNHLVAAMAIEYCPLGDLHFYLKRKRDKMKNRCGSEEIESNRHTLLEENEAKYAMRHILRGLAFLHSHGIAHRDIKPGNILLKRRDGVNKKFDNGNFSLAECTLKIGDFGLAVKMSDEDDWDETHDTLCGTPSCLAPEIARCTPKRPRQSPNITSGSQMDNQVKKYGQPADLWSTGCLLFGEYRCSESKFENG